MLVDEGAIYGIKQGGVQGGKENLTIFETGENVDKSF